MNPPPPPPHGEVPKSSGLPPGKYDIFIIPPHSSGSGFLYLPSLQPNVNSFAAGFATALFLVAIGSAIAPAVQAWWASIKGAGGAGMIMVMLAIALGAWALGRTQSDNGPGPGGGGAQNPGGSPHPDGYSAGSPPQPNTQAPGGQSQGGSAGTAPPPQPPPPQPNAEPPPNTSRSAPAPEEEKPKPTWHRTAPPPPRPPPPNTSSTPPPKSAWEKAREETKRKEEQRKAAEEARKRKEEIDRKLKELRERDAREREVREKKEAEAKAVQAAKEAREAREKAAKEAKEAKEKAAKEAESKSKGSTYAFSATGEKTNPWPRGQPTPAAARQQPPSPAKKPPPPTAKTYRDTEEDAYSYRPYDQPKKPAHKKSLSSLYSESSYAASHTTSQTTPPPSHRGPYSTKDPDKIVLKAVYSFNNAFLKTPTSQLVSGVGSVTDGLILRITTEGLFIDDDVRSVPQREWDVKAWTMKLVEVWCPALALTASASQSAARPSAARPSNPVRRLWNLEKERAATSEEADAFLLELLASCKDNCRFGASSVDASSSAFSPSPLRQDSGNSGVKVSNRYRVEQTGEHKAAGLHVLRASIRDQQGKRYVFVIAEEESWKVALGLQRLRKGTQVRALGVSSMSTNDAKTTLGGLGWV